ncbi:hypothetical protein BCR41DRAFT_88192 [Lobosporangium transversale]|uniref:Uncharacterized protein n=1 Tax=Lobosporangium transversale TaxID=64571 RepID=A0A1Y2GLJ7_9FUNG|nr:hypothetical protein BCR41DRAFT_88192 [Lobosporangium transversale]ORZ14449.1 hypothetical protein BCR41DRAFT_88192 [Lobosporangium transversale]|eukprot:XP_021880927.1 hypothetical protein BCR41DRAFT_88192 [Lobosporangium transversale]
MIRAKSHSMFESNHVSAAQRGLSSYISSLYKYQEMPIQDWINMKSKMEALELEISHVKRTNMLLNLELDKVNAHLARITANNDGEDLQEETNGWRKECEFLVQQVDWMHRQLQAAYASHMELTHPRYEAEATRELCVQVKDLTASLRMWQSAFQQAEEKYRRKCDGERVLKQNLREREAQLSSLVERLSGYESEFQKSLSNYEELMRLSTELELLEGNRDHTHFNAEDRAASSSLGKNQQGSNNISMPVVSIIRGVSDMPGALPKQDQSPTKSSETISPSAEATIVVDQLSVSILSWVALLATYMLS